MAEATTAKKKKPVNFDDCKTLSEVIAKATSQNVRSGEEEVALANAVTRIVESVKRL